MRSYIALTTILTILAALVSAAPSLGFNLFNWTSSSSTPSSDQEKCMTPSEAETTADIFRQLIQEYSHELATEALTEDFVDWASSVNIIINKGAAGPKSMDQPTFASRAAFIDGQGKQPQIPFEKIRVWKGCRFVAMRWKTGRSGRGHLTEVDDIPVHGHAIIDVVPAEPGNRLNWRIKNIFSEFNSGAWLVNLGVFKPAMLLPNADDVRHMREFGNDFVVQPQSPVTGRDDAGDEKSDKPSLEALASAPLVANNDSHAVDGVFGSSATTTGTAASVLFGASNKKSQPLRQVGGRFEAGRDDAKWDL